MAVAMGVALVMAVITEVAVVEGKEMIEQGVGVERLWERWRQ